jgi:hypothetical protein
MIPVCTVIPYTSSAFVVARAVVLRDKGDVEGAAQDLKEAIRLGYKLEEITGREIETLR